MSMDNLALLMEQFTWVNFTIVVLFITNVMGIAYFVSRINQQDKLIRQMKNKLDKAVRLPK